MNYINKNQRNASGIASTFYRDFEDADAENCGRYLQARRCNQPVRFPSLQTTRRLQLRPLLEDRQEANGLPDNKEKNKFKQVQKYRVVCLRRSPNSLQLQIIQSRSLSHLLPSNLTGGNYRLCHETQHFIVCPVLKEVRLKVSGVQKD